ncbi:Zn-ribbon domain-containing OB-fold protein [Bradyrhizobium sp. ma5]|uniref:Zn-ribbon domain-containing OB-fold protein n=1 Tax=Bradyrhizobium sp. ma5 TaxID=3344828 RepID=UPI0035D45075
MTDIFSITPESRAAGEAAASGRLLLRSCRSCGQVHYYPRPICPFCFGADTEWVEAKGTGRIYSFSVNRQGNNPYIIAYVALEEGPIMMTNIVDTPPDSVAIDQRVELVFEKDASGAPVSMFRASDRHS